MVVGCCLMMKSRISIGNSDEWSSGLTGDGHRMLSSEGEQKLRCLFRSDTSVGMLTISR